jgi:uncharacterized membrane protein
MNKNLKKHRNISNIKNENLSFIIDKMENKKLKHHFRDAFISISAWSIWIFLLLQPILYSWGDGSSFQVRNYKLNDFLFVVLMVFIITISIIITWSGFKLTLNYFQNKKNKKNKPS